jgi:hypothetical protein
MRVCVSNTLCVSICTFVLVKQVNGVAAPLRQYLYFCTSSKASKLSTGRVGPRVRLTKNAVKRREAHKMSDQARHLEAGAQRHVSTCTFIPVKQVNQSVLVLLYQLSK